MKLVCIRCGNTDFSGMDTSQCLTCPVPGCGWCFDPQNTEWVALRDAGEGGRPTAEAREWLAGWEEETGK